MVAFLCSLRKNHYQMRIVIVIAVCADVIKPIRSNSDDEINLGAKQYIDLVVKLEDSEKC